MNEELQPIKFSFIVPTYRDYINVGRCLDSIYTQTDDSFEIIVVNDGQDPDMRHTCTSSKSQNKTTYIETFFRGIRGGHHGVFEAMDLVSDASEFVCILNGDNIIYPRYIEKMYHENADIVTCQVKMNDLPGFIIDGTCFARGCIDRLNYAIRTKIAKEVRHDKMFLDADWAFINDCRRWHNGRSNVRMINIPEVLGEHN